MTDLDSSKASETRERILAAAEEMFAAKGYEGTSVREITRAAQANVAAVSYYFGGKDGLYQGVFEQLLTELRERRIRRIETDLAAAGDEVSLEDFLLSFANAFVEPLVTGERAKGFMSLFDQEMRIRKVPSQTFHRQLVEPMLDVTVSALEKVGVKLERRVAGLCLMSLVGQLIHALKARYRLEGSASIPDAFLDLDMLIEHTVRFSAAGIRACAGERYDAK